MLRSLSSATRAAGALLCVAALAGPVAAQDVGRMDRTVRESADRDEFAGAVLVARGDRVLLDQGYGMANREWGQANDGDTKFRLGSLSKQFTAVAVMLLNERGRLDLDAPVKTYLPDAPDAWDAVTVRRLLTHTSGIPNFTAFPDFTATKTLATTTDELIGRFRDRPLEFQPGQGWAYFNSGYVVLTAIIEKVSGQSYADFVSANLFRPLGMSDSGYDTHAAILPHRASGYAVGPNGVVNADYVDMSVPQGAGGLYSTTHDLLKWEQGLFGGRLLKPASLAALTTPVRNDYAMGLSVTARPDGGAYVRHNGGIEGFNTWMGHDTASDMTVIVLGNLNGSAPDRIGSALMALANGDAETATARQAVEVPVETLRAYEGVYALAPGFDITVAVADGGLTAQASGQPRIALYAEEPDAFFMRVVDARLTFNRDASGDVSGLVLHQGGRETAAPRRR